MDIKTVEWDEAHTERVLDEGFEERRRQEEKWGQQSHPNIPVFLHAPQYLGLSVAAQLGVVSEDVAKANCDKAFEMGAGTYAHILVEEVAEALDAGRDPVKLREELVQVIAVAAAWVEKIDRDAAKEAAQAAAEGETP